MELVGRILEASTEAGVWPCVVIESGRSINGMAYSGPVLREATGRGIFDAPVGVYPPADARGGVLDHLQDPGLLGQLTLNMVGAIHNAHWNEAQGYVEGELRLSLGSPLADQVENDLQAHARAGNLGALGLSIDAVGDYLPGGQVTRIHECAEVTIVSHPSAGGRIGHRLAASTSMEVPMTTDAKVLEYIRQTAPKLGPISGPTCEHAANDLGRRLAESATLREAFGKACKALAPGRTLQNELESVGSQRRLVREGRITEMVDVMALLADASMYINMAREALEATAAAAVAATAMASEADTGETVAVAAEAGGAGEAAEEVAEGAPMQESDKGQDTSALEAKLDKVTADLETVAKREAARAEAERIKESRQELREACQAAKVDPAPVLEQHGNRVLAEGEAVRIAESTRHTIESHIQARGWPEIEVGEERADTLKDELAYMLAGGPGGCLPLREGIHRAICEENMPDLRDKNRRAALLREGRPIKPQPYHGSLHRFMERFYLSDAVGPHVRIKEAVGMGEKRRLAEAVNDTQFSNTFADTLHRVFLAWYTGNPRLNWWRDIVNPVSHDDFRARHIVVSGWYDYLPDVAKGDDYQALTTPSDREETLAVAKKGGLESILWEDFLNDDIGLWQRILRKLGLTAANTIFNHVLSVVRKASQPTLSDGHPLTDATPTTGRAAPNANEGTTALSADAAGKTAFINSITAMMQMTGYGSDGTDTGQAKGVVPRYTIIPFALLEAYSYVTNELKGGNTGSEVGSALLNNLGEPIPEARIDWGTADANDWFQMASPMEAEVIRMAFLNGREDPEMFFADDERFGNLFLKDQLDLKVRHVYKAAGVDFVGIYGNVVA